MTEIDTSRERPAYLICKRGAYYRPNSQGYTTSVIQAGRYTLDEAKNITHPNGLDGPRDGMAYIHEDEKSGDEDWADYRALLDRAEKAEASLSQMRDSVAEIEGFSEDWPTHGNIPLAIVAGYSLHKSGREEAEAEIEALELALDITVIEPQKAKVKRLKAERDTAWNDAIEAAIDRIDGSWTWDDPDFMADVYDDLRRNLKKGEPT